MLKTDLALIIARGLPAPLPCGATVIMADYNLFITNLIASNGQLPANPPLEFHP